MPNTAAEIETLDLDDLNLIRQAIEYEINDLEFRVESKSYFSASHKERMHVLTALDQKLYRIAESIRTSR